MPIPFRYERVPLSPAGVAAYYATVYPLCGKTNTRSDELLSALRFIRGRWVLRSKELREVGWAACTEDKLEYARNCPPVPVQVMPRTRPCSLRICPFCHARQVMSVFRAVRDFIQEELNGAPVRVIARSYALGHKSVREPIFTDLDGSIGTSLYEVLDRHIPLRRIFRQELKQTHGGIYWHTITPVTSEGELPDGSFGNWLIRHACVAVAPPMWDWSFLKERAVLRESPDDYTLAWMIGKAFRYPEPWLSAEAPMMADFLNHLANTRLRATFGSLRGHERP